MYSEVCLLLYIAAVTVYTALHSKTTAYSNFWSITPSRISPYGVRSQ